MYRSTAKRAKRTGIWALTAALSVGAGIGAANLATLGSHLSAASATQVTHTTASAVAPVSGVTTATSAPAAATLASTSAATPVVARTATLSAPTPRTVVSVTSTSITVRSSSGAVATFGLNGSTVYLSGTTHVTVASVHPGGQVIVVPSSANPTYAGVVGILPSRGEHDSESSQGGDGN